MRLNNISLTICSCWPAIPIPLLRSLRGDSLTFVDKEKRKMIDLRSDTVTRPSEEMLAAMLQAKVGDDVFGDDPGVKLLENKAASIFGKEAAVFVPSGTMANQIAIRVHTRPGDEIICDRSAHIYNYEGGGAAANAGCSIRLIDGDRGRFTAKQILQNINPDDIHFPATSLVVAENTSNAGGGSCWELSDLKEIAAMCHTHKLKFHIDGARIFNAIIAKGYSPEQIGECSDSIAICLSKGLGAPVGSLLLGNDEFIRQARRVRKLMGGGMRQAGYLAAAGTFALENNISRMLEDHSRAEMFSGILQEQSYVEKVIPPETNILFFQLSKKIHASAFLELLKSKGILATAFGTDMIRLVFHLDISRDGFEQACQVFQTLKT